MHHRPPQQSTHMSAITPVSDALDTLEGQHGIQSIQYQKIGFEQLVWSKCNQWSDVIQESLTPYYDMTTKELFIRLTYSILPRPKVTDQILARPDLYGPLALVFTQGAILRLSMRLQEHTMIRTSLLVCLCYWLFHTFLSWGLLKVVGKDVNPAVLFCLVGYALFGHCIALTLSHFVDLLFYPAFFVFGGGASLCLGLGYWRLLRAQAPQIAVPMALLGSIAHLYWLWQIKHQYMSHLSNHLVTEPGGLGTATVHP